MKQIKLTQNRFAIVDDMDFDSLSQFKWYAENCRRKYWYAQRKVRINGKEVACLMHRLILNAPADMHVDHINGDGLDNRRINLRLCTSGQNQCNQHSLRNGVKYKGIKKVGKSWMARVQVNHKRIYLGCFDTEMKAAIAYDSAALEYHGEFARTNKMLGLL